MTTQVQNILHSFDLLAEDDKRELASEIIRRSQFHPLLPLTDDQQTEMADEIFVELDRGETKNKKQPTVNHALARLAGKATGLPPDAARNVNHRHTGGC